MYVHLRDLFAHLLGHSFENIVIDSPQESAGGNSPDLAIRSDTGLLDAKERIIYHDWIVVEAKVGKIYSGIPNIGSGFSATSKSIYALKPSGL